MKPSRKKEEEEDGEEEEQRWRKNIEQLNWTERHNAADWTRLVTCSLRVLRQPCLGLPSVTAVTLCCRGGRVSARRWSVAVHRTGYSAAKRLLIGHDDASFFTLATD